MKKDNQKRLLFKSSKILALFLTLSILLFIFSLSCSLIEDYLPISEEGKIDEATGGEEDVNEGEVSSDEGDASETGDQSSEENAEEIQDGETTEASEETLDNNGGISINVYYSDEQASYLVGEKRMVSSENRYVDALYELMKLPSDSSLVILIPDTTKINNVIVEDGIAKVDLSKEFIDDRFDSDTVDNLLIYSIVNTLTEFSEVDAITFYINGTKLDILGLIDVKDPIYRRNDLIAG